MGSKSSLPKIQLLNVGMRSYLGTAKASYMTWRQILCGSSRKTSPRHLRRMEFSIASSSSGLETSSNQSIEHLPGTFSIAPMISFLTLTQR
jgi:hypothetical protein